MKFNPKYIFTILFVKCQYQLIALLAECSYAQSELSNYTHNTNNWNHLIKSDYKKFHQTTYNFLDKTRDLNDDNINEFKIELEKKLPMNMVEKVIDIITEFINGQTETEIIQAMVSECEI